MARPCRFGLLLLLLPLSLLIACSDEPEPADGLADAGGNNAEDDARSDADAPPDAPVEDVGADAAEDVAGDVVEDAPRPCEALECPDFLRACEGPGCPQLSEYVEVVPGAGLPAGLEVQLANNNLDVASFQGRTWLAFRTAPFHFASPLAELYIISSADLQTWRLEHRVHMGTDLREPRLLVLHDQLFFYFAVLGQNAFDFEPQGMMRSERREDGSWTEAEWFLEPGFIPWRARVIDGTPYMIAYLGGEEIYDLGGGIQVNLLTTADGRDWTAAVADRPIVLESGASETDFALLEDGSLVAVARNEAGDDQTGWGSKICTAPADDLATWSCVGDRRKYDSPLVFRHRDRVWLIGRRNVTETGEYDLGDDALSPRDRTSKNLIAYSSAPKRCALWSVDPATRSVEFVLDLPSRGDTCFASIVPAGEDAYHVYNYTSPPGGRDLNWIEGQGGHTLIYRVTLTFPPSEQ